MLQFEKKGFLTPPRNIEATLETVHQLFVLDFPNSATRLDLFKNFLGYCQNIMALTQQTELLLWMNGSFATQKINPNDIDLVVFLDETIVQKHELALMLFKYPRSLELFKVDGYLVNVFPENHENHFLTRSDKAHWLDWFSKTAPNRQGKKLAKGFLELKISKDEIA